MDGTERRATAGAGGRPPGQTSGAEGWNEDEEALLAKWTRPEHVQEFLSSIEYSDEPIYRSPRSVIRDRKAHCLDGALLAAAALERMGMAPLLVDLRAVRDDDHVVAIYRRDGHIGAVAKSNFVGLRFREPIHRTLRELAVSYFNSYFNLDRDRSLREYSVPLDLRTLDATGWRHSDDNLEVIATRLDRIRHFPLMTPAMVAGLVPVDERSLRAEMLGANVAGLYVPGGWKG